MVSVWFKCKDAAVQNAETFRPRSSYGFAAAVGLLSLGFILEAAVAGDPGTLLAVVIGATGFGWAGYTVFIRPKLVVADEGLVITNMVATETVGWQDVIAIDTKYAMSVKTPTGDILAVAAPAPGRYHARTVHASELRGLELGALDQLRPGDSPRSHSGVAAQLAKLRWKAFHDAGRSDGLVRARRRNLLGAVAPVVLLGTALLLQILHG